MKARSIWLVGALAVAVCLPLIAGEYRCAADAQSCLNQMAAKWKDRGWVGLELAMDDETGTLTVQRVIPDSPAVAAGFRSGDALVALDGVRFGEDEQATKQAQAAMLPGNQVIYTIRRGDGEQQLAVTLGRMPREIMAAWIGSHMLENHVAIAQATE